MLWLWAALGVCVLAVYVAAYIFGGQVDDSGFATSHIYKSSAVARMFVPAAWVEAKVCRKHVYVQVFQGSDDRSESFSVEYYAEP